ncbi:hypothetical protein BDF14DRAFT_1291951 [Spinellus fusiger]|nr:hypothetical protein BDF14DRAFT_1291951 [Spinellus fusiger]
MESSFSTLHTPTNKKDTGYPVEYSFQSATTTHLEHQTVDTAKSIFTENSTLPVTTSHTELLSLQITTPGQYNGTLLLSFPSPGTHEPITLVHTFGLYLLDQLTKTVLPQDTPWKRPTPPLISRDYAVDFLRQMLSIHPRLGMQQGMQVQLASPKARVVCLFQSFTEETPTVHAVFYGEEELLSLVIMELDTLSAVKRP